MLVAVVISHVGTRHLRITAVMRLRRRIAAVAVMMVGQIGRHVRLVVVQIDRPGTRVVRRVVAVVIRR